MDIVKSVNNVPIRLTEERWSHIIENRDDLIVHYKDVLDCVENPDYIIESYMGALIGLKIIRKDKFLAVVYKELNQKDGFIITAYFSTKIKLEKEIVLWQKN